MESIGYVFTFEDAATCLEFVQEHGQLGYGMCYLFGAFRVQGFDHATARAMALSEMGVSMSSVPKECDGHHSQPD